LGAETALNRDIAVSKVVEDRKNITVVASAIKDIVCASLNSKSNEAGDGDDNI
jgi:hypothetical protein